MRTPTYWKVPFEWPSGGEPHGEPDPPGVAWLPAGECANFVALVGAVLAASVGPEDRLAVEAFGADGAADRVLALSPGFAYRAGWWQVVTVDGVPAGFVLPVVYEGCARDGLDEATIYHIGVVPEHRGSGLGRLLLRRATRILVDHGVWRIYCDTPADNAPMIHLFENEGWHRLPVRECPLVTPWVPGFEPQPILKGSLLEVRPLRGDDFDSLYAAASDPLIWEQHPQRDRHEPDVFRAYFAEQLASCGALIVLDARTGEAIGLSRFHGYDEERSEVEIGWTFLARVYWGGVYNRELKDLMLSHAFRFVEHVVFLVDPQNMRSRRAVEKIGAVEIGTRPGVGPRASVAYRIERSQA